MKHLNIFNASTLMLLGLLVVQSDCTFSSESASHAEIRVASRSYLTAFSTAKEQESMKKKFMSQIETRRSDNGDTEEEAMSQILLIWGISNISKFDLRDRSVMVQFCYYYGIFMDRQYAIPKLMSDRMPPSKMLQLLTWLNAESAKASGEIVAIR